MRTSPFRKATGDLLFQVFNMASFIATIVVVFFPPWTWFGVGRPLLTVPAPSSTEPWQGADVAAVVWAVFWFITILWITKVVSYWDEE